MTKLVILVVLALAFSVLAAFASADRPIQEPETSIYSKQQCSQQLQGQRFNQCQSYISSTTSRTQNSLWCLNAQCTHCCGVQVGCWPRTRPTCDKLEEGEGLGPCCNELKEVEEECQCEAMQELYKQAQEQKWSQQSSGRQPQTQDLKQIVQNLGNQCNLQVQQCRIPFAAIF